MGEEWKGWGGRVRRVCGGVGLGGGESRFGVLVFSFLIVL